MKTVGIIAEYNPFHNGHAYQLRALKELTGADYVVVAMSGDYVQRGEPAIADKYARTRMALNNGADLVLELPVQWATASAEKFAQGGIELLAATGVVDFLGFGAEDDELSLMQEIAQILTDEPEAYRAALKEALRSGVNFPTARMQALNNYVYNRNTISAQAEAVFQECCMHHDTNSMHGNTTAGCMSVCIKTSSLLSHPNNILAIEYLKAIRRGNYSMEPVLIPRVGDGYHDENAKSEYASATAIRKMLLKSRLISGTDAAEKAMNADVFPETYLPASCIEILLQYKSSSEILCADDFSQILGYRLLSLRSVGYDAYADMSRELSSRILRNIDEYRSFTQFTELLKTKELTYTRISRALLHLILNIPDDISQSCGHVPYLRILGFHRSAEPLLHEMKRNATLPVITKMADAPRTLNQEALKILQAEIFASDLYAQTARNNQVRQASDSRKQALNEINHGIIIT